MFEFLSNVILYNKLLWIFNSSISEFSNDEFSRSESDIDNPFKFELINLLSNNVANLNDIIPMVKHFERCQKYQRCIYEII